MGRDGREIFAASSVLQTTREVTRAIKRLKRGGPQRECILFRLLFHECNQGQDFRVSSATRKVRNEDVRRIENEPISASLSRCPSQPLFSLSLSLAFLVSQDEIPLQEFCPSSFSLPLPRGEPAVTYCLQVSVH